MAIVYQDITDIINRQTYGGVVQLSNATICICLSAVQDMRVVQDDQFALEPEQSEQVNQWIGLAISELVKMLVGQVLMTISTEQPLSGNTLALDGSTHLRADYPDLWDVLPAGMKTATDFTLPDANTRVPVGGDDGATGGANEATIGINNMPAHTHTEQIRGVTTIPVGELPALAVASAVAGTQNTGSAGGGDPLNIQQAFFEVRYWIVCG